MFRITLLWTKMNPKTLKIIIKLNKSFKKCISDYKKYLL